MSIKDFQIIRQIGKGAFSTVFLVKRIEDNTLYAMKRILLTNLKEKEIQNALNEVRILASINSQNVIGFQEAFYDESSRTLNLVLEYADDGDLRQKLQNRQKSKRNFKENEIWNIFIQILQGLNALHKRKIMHRDLKSANILLSKNGICKLGDLNVSKIIKMGLLYTQTGTPYYASPELWENKPYDYKSDMWSLGCILYELCALSLPFGAKNIGETYENIIKGDYEPIPSIYSKDLSIVINSLLQVNPSKRPSCGELLSNSLITKRIEILFGQITDQQKPPKPSHKRVNRNSSLADFSGESNDFLLSTFRIQNDTDIKKVLPTFKRYKSVNRFKGKGKENCEESLQLCINLRNSEVKKSNPNPCVPSYLSSDSKNSNIAHLQNFIKKNGSFLHLFSDTSESSGKKIMNFKHANTTTKPANEQRYPQVKGGKKLFLLTKSSDPNEINDERDEDIKIKLPLDKYSTNSRYETHSETSNASTAQSNTNSARKNVLNDSSNFVPENVKKESIYKLKSTVAPVKSMSKLNIRLPPKSERPQSCGKNFCNNHTKEQGASPGLINLVVPKEPESLFSKIQINPTKFFESRNLRNNLPMHMLKRLNCGKNQIGQLVANNTIGEK